MTEEVRYRFVDEQPTYRFVDEPNKSKPLGANAGLANFAAHVAGLPVDTLENAVNLTRAAQGTVAGQFGMTDWMPPLLRGSPGTSRWIKEKLKQTGEPGLSPENPAPQDKATTLAYDFTSRGGFIPGGVLPAAGSMIAEKTLGPEWAAVGALAPQAAITAYNAARAPSLARNEAQNTIRDETLRAGRQEGYVVPPSVSGGGVLSRRLENFGGKAATAQDAAIKNQQVTNTLARKELGLPKNTPLSVRTLDTLRNRLAAPYREVAAISPQAKTALEQLKQARFDANAHFKHYDVSADPASLAKARDFDNQAKALELSLEAFAKAAGKPQLIPELRQARVEIAKTFTVERALNVGSGDVSAATVGRMADAGKPLGSLETTGKFQQAFPHYMREGVQQPGISALESIFSAGLGLGGYGALGPWGVPLAALPLLRGPTRSALLSKPYQNAVMPSYGPAMTPAPAPQLLYQLGILSEQGR